MGANPRRGCKYYAIRLNNQTLIKRLRKVSVEYELGITETTEKLLSYAIKQLARGEDVIMKGRGKGS